MLRPAAACLGFMDLCGILGNSEEGSEVVEKLLEVAWTGHPSCVRQCLRESPEQGRHVSQVNGKLSGGRVQ